jgi:hypothetical protein
VPKCGFAAMWMAEAESWLQVCDWVRQVIQVLFLVVRVGLTRYQAIFFSTSDRASKEVRNTQEPDLHVA